MNDWTPARNLTKGEKLNQACQRIKELEADRNEWKAMYQDIEELIKTMNNSQRVMREEAEREEKT